MVCPSLVNDSDFPPGKTPALASTSDVTGVFVHQRPAACQGPLSTGKGGREPNAITVLPGYVHAATVVSHCLTKHRDQHGLQPGQLSVWSPFPLTSEQAQCAWAADSKNSSAR